MFKSTRTTALLAVALFFGLAAAPAFAAPENDPVGFITTACPALNIAITNFPGYEIPVANIPLGLCILGPGFPVIPGFPTVP